MVRYLTALAAVSAVAAQLMNCVFDARTLNPSYGVSYDLTPYSSEGGFTIQDNPNEADYCNWQYTFRVCNDMTPPTGCANTNPGPAFQTSNAAGCPTCFRLGDTAANGFFQLFHMNPAGGVRLNYSNGDVCTTPSGSSVARSISIDFVCYPKNKGFMPQYDEIVENIFCGYNAIIYAKSGCPQECERSPSAPFGVCSNNGICDYDQSQGQARCFCNSGYSGPACNVPGDRGLPPGPNYSGNIAGGFFGGLFGGMILLVAGYFTYSMITGKSFSDTFQFHMGGSGGGYMGGLKSGGGASAPASDNTQHMDAAYSFSQPTFTGQASGAYVPPSDSNDGPLLA